MKKILAITLLAGAALLLSSCDSMLEALFPKDTIGTNTGSNTINFKIEGWDYNYSQYGYLNAGRWSYIDPKTGDWHVTNANQKIYVEIYDNSSMDKPVATQTTFFTGLGGSAARDASVTFPALKDGNYTFKVWYDADSDGLPDLEQTNYNYWYFTTSATPDNSTYPISSQFVQGDQSVNLTVDLYEVQDLSVN